MTFVGIQCIKGYSIGTITIGETMREVFIVRVEYPVVTGAMLIQCPRGTVELPTEVVEVADSD